MTILCLDFEDYGIDDFVISLENVRNVNIQVIDKTSTEIGSWYDDHPFNKKISLEAVNEFFEKKCIVAMDGKAEKVYDKLVTEMKGSLHTVWYEDANFDIEFEIKSIKPLNANIAELIGDDDKVQVDLATVSDKIKLVTYTVKKFEV